VRVVADAVCNDCGNTWWSVNPRLRAMARAADIARKTAVLKSGKKQKTKTKAGYSARVVETTAPRMPAAWLGVRDEARLTSKNAGAGKRSRIAQGAAGPLATTLPDRIKPKALDANIDLRGRQTRVVRGRLGHDLAAPRRTPAK
jgi:hypothetical protein